MPPPPAPTVGSVKAAVLSSVQAQIADLQPTLENLALIELIKATLKQLRETLAPAAGTASLVNALDAVIGEIPGPDGQIAAFGQVLVDLYSLQQVIAATTLNPSSLQDGAQNVLLGVLSQVRQLLNFRPDVDSILGDLSAIKNLRGGPADATAFHDFNVLQLALRSVWMHAFDYNLKLAAQELYEQATRLYGDAGLAVPDFEDVEDVNALTDLIASLGYASNTSCLTAPTAVVTAFGQASISYSYLSAQQQSYVGLQAQIIAEHSATDSETLAARQAGLAVLNEPLGAGGRLTKLVNEIGKMISEPYAFDVFAPDSFNYGLLITYRQRWEPGEYQAGDLVATIPLAPGESRKFTTKKVVKTSRAQKEMEKSMSSKSMQSSETSRADASIMQKVSSATNFKMTSAGSFNIGIGSVSSTTEFTANQAQESTLNKQEFHEATLKAAEEYRKERSIEVDLSSSMETEETMTAEISNPNNEITVTYLYYELQRRYAIREFLYRARPVILIAQDVPAPHQIDEAWLIQYQWILSRVLLDDSFRPALNYLTSGFAGDEVATDVLRASWEKQKALVDRLEALTTAQQDTRDALREQITLQTFQKDMLDNSLKPADLFNMLNNSIKTGDYTFQARDSAGNPVTSGQTADDIEANRRAAETRLKYVEEALSDAQDKLKAATSAFETSTKEYTAALQNIYTRHVAIDQLRVHVKQNIFYYMQAIWDFEPPDQRFFRLYKKLVYCPEAQQSGPVESSLVYLNKVTGSATVEFTNISAPGITGGAVGGYQHELVEVADIDNPLGYKGNYIIFPLKAECYLTKYMLSEFIDNYLGALDPDGTEDFDAEDFEAQWNAPGADRTALQNQLTKYVQELRRRTDEIIVPTGQLFVEALPGSHPLLEDFKRLHRALDVGKVEAEVRHAELENLRLAARLAQGQDKPELLSDPDIEKQININGSLL